MLAPAAPAPAWGRGLIPPLSTYRSVHARVEGLVKRSPTMIFPVRSLQQLLRARNHPVSVDGIFGPNTEAAVPAFQQRRTSRPTASSGGRPGPGSSSRSSRGLR